MKRSSQKTPGDDRGSSLAHSGTSNERTEETLAPLDTAALELFRKSYSDVVVDVRWLGRMIEVEFAGQHESSSLVLRYLSSFGLLGSAISGYFLKQLRIHTAVSEDNVLTVQIPAAYMTQPADRRRLSLGLIAVCEYIRSGDAMGLTECLIDPESLPDDGKTVPEPQPPRFFAIDTRQFLERENRQTAVRVAWLYHGIDERGMIPLDESFRGISDAQLTNAFEQFGVRADPIVMNPIDIQSRTGARIHLYPVLLPVSSLWMQQRIESRRRPECQQMIQKGLEIAHQLGCRSVSLGQYSSIATRNGRSLNAGDMGVTTGNSYTAALAVQAIDRALTKRDLDRSSLVLAIAGAAGNMGRAIAEILAPQCRFTILVGSGKPGSRERLEDIASRLPRTDVAADLSAIKFANVVLTSMNSIGTSLFPEHFSANAIVCDVSVPPAVHPGISAARPDLEILKGGIAKLPHGEHLDIPGFPLPAGVTFGCMAEGMLLGLEGIFDRSFAGLLTAEKIHRIERIACTHGFELADDQTYVLNSK